MRIRALDEQAYSVPSIIGRVFLAKIGFKIAEKCATLPLLNVKDFPEICDVFSNPLYIIIIIIISYKKKVVKWHKLALTCENTVPLLFQGGTKNFKSGTKSKNLDQKFSSRSDQIFEI
jgi:hypothetical protein